MKRKELQEYRNKSVIELEKELRVYRERLNSLKLDLAAGKVKNIKEIRSLKKSIAQFITFIKEKSRSK